MHLAHWKVTASEWLSKRNSFSFKKKFYNFEEDFVWQIPHFCLSCAQNLKSLQYWKKCSFHKRKMLSQHPLLWILTSAIPSLEWKQIILQFVTVKLCKVLPDIVCFCNFTFRLLKISIIEFLLIHSAGNQQISPKKFRKAIPLIFTISGLELPQAWNIWAP